ncbi:MAG: DUF4347 domain-containing protein, partial [Alphaproteobacteria bacterium]|nr:DUF4347 domain-containing protein [Alphaproteobacteria bacterium]
FYGCNLAESIDGQGLIQGIASLTGADIAASTDLTGAEVLGGDWVLEYSTGDIEAGIAVTELLQANYAHVLVSQPDAALVAPSDDPLIGEQVTFTITFDNLDAVDTGFAPYVNLFMPFLGADGTNAGDADGLSFVSATLLGQAVDTQTITLVDIDGGTAGIQFDHPLAVDGAGDPLTITIDPALGIQEGDQLIVLTLPFGSITPGLPSLDIVITANVSIDADVGTGLDVIANAGFELGDDALDNPATDPSIQAVTLNAGNTSSLTITPQLYRITTTLNAPEGETVTGSNFERSYDIQIEVAAGQTIDNASLDFTFSEEMVYTSAVASGGGVLDITNLGQVTGGDLSDDVLTVDYVALTGTQTITANFYISEFDQAGADVLNPLTGAARTLGEFNNVVLAGNWTPVDVRDAVTPISDTSTAAQIVAKSIAIQKSVVIQNDTNTAGATPGDTLEYTLDIQISDFFAYDTITLEDIIQDGQLLDGGFTPTLNVTRQGVADPADVFTLGGDLTDTTLGNDDHDLDFDVSAIIIGGMLEGGFFNAATLGATTATVTFRAIIQDEYDSEAGNLFIKQGDALDADVTIAGELLDGAYAQQGVNVADISDAGVVVPTETVALTVYAVNGVVGPSTDIKPGDDVTFRLEYNLVTGDLENFTMSAFLPLPVFDVDDTNADSVGGDVFAIDGVNAVPTVGLYRYGPTATADVTTGIPVPAVSVDAGANSVTFDLGDLSDAANDGGTVDVLFTLRVTSEPFADNLVLSTLSQQVDENTPAVTTITNALGQINLQQPFLEPLIKGVVGTNLTFGDTNTPIYSADDPTVVFKEALNVDANPLNSVIGSDTLDAVDFNGDLTDVDEGDIVRFALIIENTGTSPNGAFDISIQDIIPVGFVVPGGGINLRVVDGAGNAVAIETPAPDVALFAGGITLQDGATGAIGAFDASNGQNIIIITYDLEVANAVESVTTITNTATLTNYANTEGGPDFTIVDLTDTADVTTATAQISKQLLSTDQVSTIGTNVIIGEVVEYRLRITVPEGQSSSALIVDTLDAGLAFVGITSITASGGITTDVVGGFAGVQAAVVFANVGGGADNDARQATFDLGTLTNVNVDNSSNEVITIIYEAVVVNTADAQGATILDNSAVYTTANETGITRSQSVTVVEPVVDVTVTPDVTQGDTGDTITWTIVIDAPIGNLATAFDVDFNNLIPAGLTYVPASLTNTAGVVPDSTTENGGDFNVTFAALTAGQTSTFTIQTTVDLGATFGQNFQDTGTATWHSISGALADPSALTTVDTERTGAGGLNDYIDTQFGEINVLGPSPVLTLDSTSEVTNGIDVTIGEIVRIRYKMGIPESTTMDLRVEALLPTGLQFLDDGTATIGFVFDGAGITSTTIVGANLAGNEATVDALEPVVVLVSGVDVSAGPFGSGTNPQFLLGDVVNSDNDANQEFVIIEFNALVLNTVDNNAGDTITVDARVLTGAATEIYGSADVTDVDISVVEPVITGLDKSVIATDGTIATYQITFGNVSGETAYELNVLDILPANITNLGNVTIVSSSGITGLVDNSTVAQLDIDIATMVDTGSITITYTADVTDNSLVVADTDVDVIWTSVVGGTATLGISSAGASGSTTGERTGSGVGENDYVVAEGAGLSVINGTIWEDNDADTVIDGTEVGVINTQVNLLFAGADGIFGNGDDITLSTLTDVNGDYSFGALPAGDYRISVQPSGMANGLYAPFSHTYDPSGSAVDNFIEVTIAEAVDTSNQNFGVFYNFDAVLTLDSTSEAANGTDVTIGEIIRVRYEMELREGLTTDLRIEPLLLSGIQFYDDGTATVAFVSDGGGITSTTIVGAALAGNEGTVNGLEPVIVLASGVDVSVGPFGSGTDPQFLLGDVTNADTDENREYVVVEFNVLVLNTADNNDGDTIVIDARTLTGAVTEVYSAAGVTEVSINVVEPAITALDKSVISVFAGTATYQITFGNTSGETAYELNILDLLPANINNLGNVTIVSSSGITGLVDNSTVAQLDIDIATMVDTGSITITYTADIIDESLIVPDAAVDVTWTSIVGGVSTLGVSTAGASGSTTGERTGSGVGENDYIVSESAGISALTGTIWEDNDADTVIDGSEVGVINTQVNLLYSGIDGIFGNGDDVALTTITDANGGYTFGALAAGDYRISVQPSGMANGLYAPFSHTYDPSGSVVDNLVDVIVLDGVNTNNQNFGVFYNFDTPILTLDSTSEVSNGTDVTIGEIIRVRYEMELREGLTTDLRIEPL